MFEGGIRQIKEIPCEDNTLKQYSIYKMISCLIISPLPINFLTGHLQKLHTGVILIELNVDGPFQSMCHVKSNPCDI